MKTTTIYFSATNTTRTIVNEIARHLADSTKEYNLAKASIQDEIFIPSSEILLLGMPVYGGRIPGLVIESLKKVKGNGTPVILIAVYGNREFEDALVEMQDCMEANGFIVIAAAAFIAQHSIFPHTAKGRPDASDFHLIEEFSIRCKTLLKKNLVHRTASISLPGNRPYKIPGKIPLKMLTDAHCTECGTCIKVCPVNAIPSNNPHLTDFSKCIHCGRCMQVCPEHARHYGGLLYNVAGLVFRWKNRKRKEPEFFF